MLINPIFDYWNCVIIPKKDTRDDLQKEEDREDFEHIRNTSQDIVLVLAKGPDENGILSKESVRHNQRILSGGMP